MLRTLITGLVALGLAACTYRSDVDLAPVADRVARPVVPPGDYCEATASNPPYVVRSAEDCVRILWDAATRTYALRGVGDEAAPTRFAPVSLGEDLYLLQADAGEDGPDGRRHVMLALARGAAFFMTPMLERERFVALARQHPGVVLSSDPAREPIITAGEPAAIKDLLRAAALQALGEADLDAEELSVAIRDRAGAADHEASGMQTMNIIELVTAIFALQAGE